MFKILYVYEYIYSYALVFLLAFDYKQREGGIRGVLLDRTHKGVEIAFGANTKAILLKKNTIMFQ